MALSGWDVTKRINIAVSADDIATSIDGQKIMLKLSTADGPQVVRDMFAELETSDTDVSIDSFTDTGKSFPEHLFIPLVQEERWPYGNFVDADDKMTLESGLGLYHDCLFQSTYTVDDDFSIEEEFTMYGGSGWGCYMEIIIYDSSGNWWRVRRRGRDSSNNRYAAIDAYDQAMTYTATNGYNSSVVPMKITRSGSVLTAWTWQNSRWEWDGDITGRDFDSCPSGEVYIVTGIRNDAPADSLTGAQIGYIKINSGTIGWRWGTPGQLRIAVEDDSTGEELTAEIVRWSYDSSTEVGMTEIVIQCDLDSDDGFKGYLYFDGTHDHNVKNVCTTVLGSKITTRLEKDFNSAAYIMKNVRCFMQNDVFRKSVAVGAKFMRVSVERYDSSFTSGTVTGLYWGWRDGVSYGFDAAPTRITFNGGETSILLTLEPQWSDPFEIDVFGDNINKVLMFSSYSTGDRQSNRDTGDSDIATAYVPSSSTDYSAVQSGAAYSNLNAQMLSCISGVQYVRATRELWGFDFKGVFHVPFSDSFDVYDSKGENPPVATPAFTASDIVDGYVGKALDLGNTATAHFVLSNQFDKTEGRFVIVCKTSNTTTAEVLFATPASAITNQTTFGFVTSGALQITDAGGTTSISTETGFNDGSFHVIDFSWSATGRSVVVDGTALTMSNSTATFGTDPFSSEQLLGYDYVSKNAVSNSFSGVIDNFKFFTEEAASGYAVVENDSESNVLTDFSNFPIAVALDQTYDLFALIVTGFLDQLYEFPKLIVDGILDQEYHILDSVFTYIEQVYGIKLLSSLTQNYGETAQLRVVLTQWLTDSTRAIGTLEAIYASANKVRASTDQRYSLTFSLISTLINYYHIAGATPVSFIDQEYAIKNIEEVLSRIQQLYTLYPESLPLEIPTAQEVIVGGTMADDTIVDGEVVDDTVVGGTSMGIISTDVEYAQGAYVGSGTVVLANFGDWLLIDYRQSIVISNGSQNFYMVVVSKSRKESHKTETLSVECKSQAVLLDFPFASEVPESPEFVVSGTESEIVNDLAALEGMSIVWEMPINDTLTLHEIQVPGRSPLDCIREIVNELGGILQSYPDGTIHAVPKYIINSHEYHTVDPEIIYTSGEDFVSLNSDTDKRDGFNKYSVSNVAATDGYSLESEEISPSHYEVRAYKVPWDSQAVLLTTSELTNVHISDPTIFSAPITEEIEIVEGAGKVSKPWYSTETVNYKSSTDLGTVTIIEDGTVSTEIEGNTLVEITYRTKYWLWDCYDSDEEDVQFILEVDFVNPSPPTTISDIIQIIIGLI